MEKVRTLMEIASKFNKERISSKVSQISVFKLALDIIPGFTSKVKVLQRQKEEIQHGLQDTRLMPC